MHTIRTAVAAAFLVLPLLASSQTANTPGGSASTGTPLDQTRSSPSSNAPATTSTSPSTTNPTGAVTKSPTKSGKIRNALKKSDKSTPLGDEPSYPAPAKDGTPTK